MPSSTQASPSRRAVVRTIDGSDPACSSVIAYASRRSPRHAGRRYRSFCSSVAFASGIAGRHGMSQSAPVALPHCSSTTICCRTSNPRPPSRSAWLIALKPASSTACFAVAKLSGLSPSCSSHSSSSGISTRSVKSRARSWSSRSSGVRRMSIGRASLADAHARYRCDHPAGGQVVPRIARVSRCSSTSFHPTASTVPSGRASTADRASDPAIEGPSTGTHRRPL